MAPNEIDVLSLPQKGVWQCYVHKLRTWVAGDGGLPVRPYLMLVINTEVGDALDAHRIVSGTTCSRFSSVHERLLFFAWLSFFCFEKICVASRCSDGHTR